MRYVDPDGCWVDNEDGTFTAEDGDTLWNLYGSDWQEKSGFEGDPTKLQVGDTVGKKNTTSNDNSENKNNTLWDFSVGNANGARSLYSSLIVNKDLENGQCNIALDAGIAEYAFESPTANLFGGNLKFKVDGTLGGFTGQTCVGIKDYAIGADGDVSMLKLTTNFHVSLFGVGVKFGIEGFLGGFAAGTRAGYGISKKLANIIGYGVNVSWENVK